MASTIKVDKIAQSSGTPEFTIPTADGAANTFLKTDGSGVLSFGAVTTTALTGSTNTWIPTITAANALTGTANFTYDGNILDVKNSGTASSIKLYCESSNAHAQEIKAAPHAGSSAWTLTLPPTAPSVSGQVLSATTAGVASWATDAGGLFSSYAILADQKNSGTSGGQCSSGAWRLHDLQTSIADPDSIVTSLTSNVFTLAAGNYLIKWTTTGYSSHYQSNRLSINGGAVVGTGGTGRTANADEPNVQMIGMARVTPGTSTGYIIEQRANTTNANGFGNAGSLQTETYAWVEIYKES